jgi:ribose transport system substrate-binding protein
MKTTSSLLQTACTLFIILALAACSGKTGQDQNAGGQAEKKKFKIGLIPKGSTHTHWKTVQAGAQKAANEDSVTLLWQGPQKEDDRQMQIQVVQNFISQGVDVLGIAPLDAQSMVPQVQSAVKRGIPVLIFDSALGSDDYSSYIATNNSRGGELCAARLAEVMGGKGKLLVLRYAEGSASTLEREAGFLAKIKEYPGIQIVSDNQYAGATMEKAFQVSQNLLNRFQELDGIFCSNESATQGMLRALQTAGKAGKIKFVGFDYNQTLIDAINAGEVQGLAMQDPFKMGYETVKAAVAILKKQPVQRQIDTGVTMLTKDNLNSPEVQALLGSKVQ